MLLDFLQVRRPRRTEREAFELIDVVGRCIDVAVARRVLPCPFLQLRPVAALTELPHGRLGRLGDGGVARSIICGTEHVTAEGVEAVRDVRKG